MGKIELFKEITFTTPETYNANDYLSSVKKRLSAFDNIHYSLLKEETGINEHTLLAGKKYKCKILKLENSSSSYLELKDIANYLILGERALFIGNQGIALAYNLFREELPDGFYNSYGESFALLGDGENFEYLLSYLQKEGAEHTMSVTKVATSNIHYLNNSYILCFCDI